MIHSAAAAAATRARGGASNMLRFVWLAAANPISHHATHTHTSKTLRKHSSMHVYIHTNLEVEGGGQQWWIGGAGAASLPAKLAHHLQNEFSDRFEIRLNAEVSEIHQGRPTRPGE